MPEIVLQNGKYKFIADDNGTNLRCLRYNKEWRGDEWIGDGAIHALFNEILTLKHDIAYVRAEIKRGTDPSQLVNMINKTLQEE